MPLIPESQATETVLYSSIAPAVDKRLALVTMQVVAAKVVARHSPPTEVPPPPTRPKT